MRISDWSSDVCSADLLGDFPAQVLELVALGRDLQRDQIEAERADHARQELAHALQPMGCGHAASPVQAAFAVRRATRNVAERARGLRSIYPYPARTARPTRSKLGAGAARPEEGRVGREWGRTVICR